MLESILRSSRALVNNPKYLFISICFFLSMFLKVTFFCVLYDYPKPCSTIQDRGKLLDAWCFVWVCIGEGFVFFARPLLIWWTCFRFCSFCCVFQCYMSFILHECPMLGSTIQSIGSWGVTCTLVCAVLCDTPQSRKTARTTPNSKGWLDHLQIWPCACIDTRRKRVLDLVLHLYYYPTGFLAPQVFFVNTQHCLFNVIRSS